MTGWLGAIPDIAVVALQIVLALFLLGWAGYSIMTLGLILMKHKPESKTEAISIGLREAPFAIALALLLLVGPAVSDTLDEVQERREEGYL